MIVSASYRSDIPAFHATWFMARLWDGHVMVRNPYGGPDYRVPLEADDVDGFVFWTRNAAPFREPLAAARRIAPFVVHYTVTGYPKVLERGVPPAGHAIAEIERIAAIFGRRSVVWRYDPVLWSERMPPAFHLENFARLADRLAPHVDEVVFSAATLYAKSRRNLARHAPNLAVEDPPDAAKSELLRQLAELAAARGLTPTLCAQPHLLQAPLVAAKCVDAERLAEIGGRPFRARRKGHRPGCDCAESRDIGRYDSCAHGCFYCYAVADHDKVAAKGGTAPHEA